MNKVIGVVRGIDETYHVEWIDYDGAALLDPDTGDTVFEFASANPDGFIDEEDVLDQAQDIVSLWDGQDFEEDFEL